MYTNVSYNDDAEKKKKSYDAYCKQLFSNKYILANLLKYTMKEFEDESISDIVSYIENEVLIGKEEVFPDEIIGMNVEDTRIHEGKITHDILFQTGIPKKKDSIFVDVEIQNKIHLDYPLSNREFYYIARMQSRQYRFYKSTIYKNMKKVVSIWIYPNLDGKEKGCITRIRPIEQVQLGDKYYDEKEIDKAEIIFIVLDKNSEDTLIRLFSVILDEQISADSKEKILKEEYEVKLSKMERMELEDMCDMGQAVFEKGEKQGLSKGIGIGINEGIEIGEERKTVESIKNVMISFQVTLDDAMKALFVPESD